MHCRCAGSVCGEFLHLPHHRRPLPDILHAEEQEHNWLHQGSCLGVWKAVALVEFWDMQARDEVLSKQAGAAGIQIVSLFWFYRIVQVSPNAVWGNDRQLRGCASSRVCPCCRFWPTSCGKRKRAGASPRQADPLCCCTLYILSVTLFPFNTACLLAVTE